jgi:hypothetical protein
MTVYLYNNQFEMALPNTQLSYLVIMCMLFLSPQHDWLLPAQRYAWPSASIESYTTCQRALIVDMRARQILTLITFRQSNKISLEQQASTYQSSKRKTGTNEVNCCRFACCGIRCPPDTCSLFRTSTEWRTHEYSFPSCPSVYLENRWQLNNAGICSPMFKIFY